MSKTLAEFIAELPQVSVPHWVHVSWAENYISWAGDEIYKILGKHEVLYENGEKYFVMLLEKDGEYYLHQFHIPVEEKEPE